MDSSIVIMDPDGSNKERVIYDGERVLAFAPSWSPDGQWIAFGFGNFFGDRHKTRAKIMMVRSDGTGAKDLTGDIPNAGFPSFSADGKANCLSGLGRKGQRPSHPRLENRSVRVLTSESDNLPGWSPDGSRIVFTRRQTDGNYDVFTIKPDGSDLRRLTNLPANDGHAVWSTDGKHILWNSGMNGWRDEAALYDNTFQPYGTIFIMNADGTGKRPLTDSQWEDAMPQFIRCGASSKTR